MRERHAHRRGQHEDERAAAPVIEPVTASPRFGRPDLPREPEPAGRHRGERFRNADRHASSVVVATVPAGVPPTLISLPSGRPRRSLAAAISRPGVAGSLLSAATQLAVPAVAAFCARRAAAAEAVASWGPLSTTRAALAFIVCRTPVTDGRSPYSVGPGSGARAQLTQPGVTHRGRRLAEPRDRERDPLPTTTSGDRGRNPIPDCRRIAEVPAASIPAVRAFVANSRTTRPLAATEPTAARALLGGSRGRSAATPGGGQPFGGVVAKHLQHARSRAIDWPERGAGSSKLLLPRHAGARRPPLRAHAAPQ